MTQIGFRHILITMYNWRLDRSRVAFEGFDELDDNWLRYRWRLFMRYTVPSVAAQSNSDFSWVILCHPQSPDWLRTSAATVTMNADVHFSFQRQDPFLDRFTDGATDALLVTRIDSDDVWHRRAMERIREDCEADPYTSQIVTFTDGYLLDDEARRMRPHYDFSPPFCTKISYEPGLDPFDLGGNHGKVRYRYPARSISDGEPMFAVVEHGQRPRGRGCDPADPRWLTSSATAEILDRDFAVTLTDTEGDQPGRPADLTGRRPARPLQSAQEATRRRQRVIVSIACFQSWDSLPRAVESMLAQTYPDLLVVVTNDGDADPRWDVLSHVDDPRLIRVDHAVNRGRYFVDQVAAMARLGDYLVIQDADGWSEPGRVDALLKELRRRHSAAAVSPHYQYWSGSPGSPTVVSPGSTDAPVTAPYQDNLGQPSWYHALFDAPRLLNVGGCYGGYRHGYDAFLLHLMRMTGAVAAVDQPLYHRREPAQPMESGSGSSSPCEPHRDLALLYAEAYHFYCEYLQGNISFSLLSRQLRTLAWRHVSATDWEALRDEAYRLRWTVRTNVTGGRS
jgi:hypothetical protein